MLPEKVSYGDRFKLARDVGFEVVQVPTEPDAAKAEEIKKAADFPVLNLLSPVIPANEGQRSRPA